MSTNTSETAIPKEVAYQLCAEIRRQFGGKWWTFAGMQCWGCVTFSKGDPAGMCVGSRADYRGCNLVNARHDSQAKKN